MSEITDAYFSGLDSYRRRKTEDEDRAFRKQQYESQQKMQQQQMADAETQKKQRTIFNMVKYLEQAKASNNPNAVMAAWGVIRPKAQEIFNVALPETYDPSVDQGLEVIKAQMADLYAEEKPDKQNYMNVSPGGAVIDPRTGQVIYKADFKPDARGKQQPAAPPASGREFALPNSMIQEAESALGRKLSPQEKTDLQAKINSGQPFDLSSAPIQKPPQTKAAVQTGIKGAQVNQARVALERVKKAIASLRSNSFADGGPIDQWALKWTPQGQELTNALQQLNGPLTALTRIPGQGSQSDYEAKLQQMQMPGLEFAPEVNANAVAGIENYINELEAAITGSQPAQGNQSSSGWSIKKK